MELRVSMFIACEPKRAYDAFCDGRQIGNFWFSSSSRPWESGEVVRLRHEAYGADFDIQVVEAIPHSLIRFDWGEGAERRHCRIAITPREGGCLVSVSESGWPSDRDVTRELRQNQTGWVFMLTCLKAYLENGISNLHEGLVMGD